ncbi:MAG TPA: hypothetical protein VN691_04865 [Steroidobacteraceae bacterium]|nr:hypothetical protein [Steroidobacteraceae bacterium]
MPICAFVAGGAAVAAFCACTLPATARALAPRIPAMTAATLFAPVPASLERRDGSAGMARVVAVAPCEAE